jgi:hypothetical protein
VGGGVERRAVQPTGTIKLARGLSSTFSREGERLKPRPVATSALSDGFKEGRASSERDRKRGESALGCASSSPEVLWATWRSQRSRPLWPAVQSLQVRVGNWTEHTNHTRVPQSSLPASWHGKRGSKRFV